MKEYTETGKHLLIDIWLNEFDEDIVVYIAHALNKFDYHIVSMNGKIFSGGGETVFWVLEESHCSVHTYPEHKYISIDLYTCDDNKNVHEFFNFIIKKLESKINKVKSVVINRGDKDNKEFIFTK